MFGSCASKAAIVSLSAALSASEDCQPGSFAVPVTLGAALTAALSAADGAAPDVSADGAGAPLVPGVAPLVQAPAIITIEAPRANTVRRIRCPPPRCPSHLLGGDGGRSGQRTTFGTR